MKSKSIHPFANGNFGKVSILPQRPTEVRDIVVVKVVEINNDLGLARVELLEYDGLIGSLSFSELTRRGRIRSIREYIRLNQQDVLEVIQSNSSTGQVDLSKKHVTPQDQEECLERFSKSKRVDNLLRQVALATRLSLNRVYDDVAWPLYESKYQTPFNAFLAVSRGIDALASLEIDDSIKTSVVQAIHSKFNLAPQMIKAHFSLQSNRQWPNLHHLDIDEIRTSLMEGLQYSRPNEPIQIQLVSSPEYQISITSVSVDAGKQTLLAAIEAIKKRVIQFGGDFSVVKAPDVTTLDSNRILDPTVAAESSEKDESDEENGSESSGGDDELAAEAEAAQAKIDAEAAEVDNTTNPVEVH